MFSFGNKPDITEVQRIPLTPELIGLITGALNSPSFRDKLLIEAEARINTAKADLAVAQDNLKKAESVYRAVLELGGPLPRVIKTDIVNSYTTPGKKYAIQLWLEQDGHRHWECTCESYKFSPSTNADGTARPKTCKHIQFRNVN